jgi:hypothetical protein
MILFSSCNTIHQQLSVFDALFGGWLVKPRAPGHGLMYTVLFIHQPAMVCNQGQALMFRRPSRVGACPAIIVITGMTTILSQMSSLLDFKGGFA